MGHADKISTRDTYKISGQNVSACLVETNPRAQCYPAWAEPPPRALPSPGWHLLLSNAMSFCPTEAVSLHYHFLLFVLTAPWEQRERLCAVCSWECTSMDNRAAEILWCLPLSEQIVPVPLLSLGFCGFFFQKVPESAHCTERRTLNWTKMIAVLSHHLY